MSKLHPDYVEAFYKAKKIRDDELIKLNQYIVTDYPTYLRSIDMSNYKGPMYIENHEA